MNDIEPVLLRLRGIEVKIALGEFYLSEQRALVERLRARGLHMNIAYEILRLMEDSLRILRVRRSDALGVRQSEFD